MNPESPAASEHGSSGPASSLGAAIGARNLIIIIITMPLVFLIAAIGAVLLFGPPGGKKSDEPTALAAAETAPAAIPAPTGDAIMLPEGARAGAMALDGDRLALRVEGPEGETIIVYDLAAGRVITAVPVLTETPPQE